jgi:hypothetical protein
MKEIVNLKRELVFTLQTTTFTPVIGFTQRMAQHRAFLI